MVSRPLLSWGYFLRSQNCAKKLLSSSVAPTPAEPKLDETEKQTAKIKRSKSMVAAAFQSLKEPESQQFASLDEEISAAESVDSLLRVADNNQVTKKNALRVVSVLAEWASENKIKISEFETDARFNKLCSMLGRNYKTKSTMKVDSQDSADLATVLEVTGDDEAAKMVNTISFEQMIKVMAALALKKRRSTPLLRSLAFNLCRHSQQLNVKQSADLMYSMASLSFPDASLLDKVRADLSESLPTNQKTAPVGSILTSIGLLRHKDPALLESLCEWLSRNTAECRPQDLVSLLLTLAHVGYTPSNADELIQRVCSRLQSVQDVPVLPCWLDVVWSLTVLGRTSPELAASVLDPQFVSRLHEVGGLSMAAKLKLLNINAVAKLELKNYKGPVLVESELAVPLTRSRSKELLTKSVLDTLSNLLPSQTYLKPGRDTGMGFLIEGECMVDSKGNPLAVAETPETDSKKKTKATRGKNGSKIALLVFDYCDLCRGVSDPTGPNLLACRLLQSSGYKVLVVPLTEYNPREKLVQRVQYLDSKLKSLVKKPSSR